MEKPQHPFSTGVGYLQEAEALVVGGVRRERKYADAFRRVLIFDPAKERAIRNSKRPPLSRLLVPYRWSKHLFEVKSTLKVGVGVAVDALNSTEGIESLDNGRSGRYAG